MQVGIDLSIAGINQAGTGLYAAQLAAALPEVAAGDTFRFFAAGQRRDMSASKTLRTRAATLYRDLVWMHALLPLRARRAGVDVLHMPAGIGPLRAPCPTVLTIHDTVAFRFPTTLPGWQRRYFHAFVPAAARRAARIVTDSEHSKQEILVQLGQPADKVTVIPLAAGREFTTLPPELVQQVRSRYGLSRFVLTVGTIEPRKNLQRLLEAFAIVRRRGYMGAFIHAGPSGWMSAGVSRAVEQNGLRDCVRFLGRVPLSDLVGLYNAADVCAYPSLYEGFGLPVLEAMACACPVVTSNRSSLPEVAGDAAELVDPDDVEAIASAIQSVCADSALAADLRRRGLDRARCFSWQRCALETMAVYREATGRAAEAPPARVSA